MTNSVIKICNFVHYFFREGGYLDCDQFSLLHFSLFMGGGRVQREIVPNSLYSLLSFLNSSISDLEDKLYFNGEEIDYDYYYPSINTTGSDLIEIRLERKLSKELIENLKSNRMLGFKVTWSYDRKFKNWAKFIKEDIKRRYSLSVSSEN